MYIYLLDLMGTFAFAVFGAHVALKKKFDLFGIVTCSFLTAVGGGTIREILLLKSPFYFFDNTYILVIIAGSIFTITTYYFFERIERFMLVIDAIGLSAFALIGARAAADAGLGLVAIILLAVITAAGGGILRDISVRQIPLVFREELYATPAALLGLAFGLCQGWRDAGWFIAAVLAMAFLIRLVSIFKGVGLWRPYHGSMSIPHKSRAESRSG
jgi:uncharacterized membrane protein YeiH